MALHASYNPITHNANIIPTPKPMQIQHQAQDTKNGYHRPEPTNTFRINPLLLSSVKNIDIDGLQESFGKVIQQSNNQKEANAIQRQRICNESEEIKALRNRINSARINEARAYQIHETQARRMKNLTKDSQLDEEVLSNVQKEKEKAMHIEGLKRQERFKAKYVLQDQMKERDNQKAESMKEYLRDKELVNHTLNKMKEEDIAAIQEDKRKKEIAKTYMDNAYAEKVERQLREKGEEQRRKEAERRYFEEKEARDLQQQLKKAAILEEKDKIFEQLCWEKAQESAQKEHWEKIRNELHVEEDKRRMRLIELEEKAKKQNQKEEMLQWAIEQMKVKELRKKEEDELEVEFKKKLLEKYAAEERLEQYNAMRRKQKELDWRDAIEKQWKLKLQQYQLQKEKELIDLENARKAEREKRMIIEEEKARLIKENEEVLKTYYAKGYLKSINS